MAADYRHTEGGTGPEKSEFHAGLLRRPTPELAQEGGFRDDLLASYVSRGRDGRGPFNVPEISGTQKPLESTGDP
jgi:hypothetical protein